MTEHMLFSWHCGSQEGLTGPIVNTPYQIPTAQSFWTLFHMTDSSHVSVHSVTHLFTKIACSMLVLFAAIPAFMGVPLCSTSLVVTGLFKILHTILPHYVNWSHCLYRLSPTGNEFSQLASALHSEIISYHSTGTQTHTQWFKIIVGFPVACNFQTWKNKIKLFMEYESVTQKFYLAILYSL